MLSHRHKYCRFDSTANGMIRKAETIFIIFKDGDIKRKSYGIMPSSGRQQEQPLYRSETGLIDSHATTKLLAY